MLSHLANHERLLFLLRELPIVGLFQPLIVSNSKSRLVSIQTCNSCMCKAGTSFYAHKIEWPMPMTFPSTKALTHHSKQRSNRSVWRPRPSICAVLLTTTALATALPYTAKAGSLGEYIDGGEVRDIDSSTSFTGELIVGKTGVGTLHISKGATVTNDDVGSVGYSAGSNGTVTVDGAGSSWVNGAPGTYRDLTIGVEGSGSLSITNGGSVQNANGIIGGGGGVGNVVVKGPGSTWTNHVDLYSGPGNGSTGTLSIEDGGKVISVVSYIGYLPDSEGTVSVSGANSTLELTGDDLTVGVHGKGTLNIAKGGLVTVGTETGGDYSGPLTIGYSNGSTSTLNIGAAANETAIGAGTLKAAFVEFGSGTGTIVFNHTDTDYEFDTDVKGNGALAFYSGNTSLTGDYSGFTGSATVNGGVMAVNSTFNQAISVLRGGTLGGTGTVSDVTLASGAILAPGNSIGTLNVNGDLDFVAGSTYQVEVDKDGHSDKLVSTGSVSIDTGATLAVLAENGTDDGSSYAANTEYSILSADTLTGEFDTITENFAFLDASVAYSDKEATLTLTRSGGGGSSFADKANTPNQKMVANVVEGLGSGNPVYDAVVSLPDGAPAGAFNQLTGELHPTIQTTMTTNSTIDRNAANQRLRSTMGGIGGSGDQITYGFHNEDDITAAMTRTPQMWAQAFGMWGETDATANTAKIKNDSKGFLVGLDAEIWSGWRTGAFAGYSNTTNKANAINSQGDIDNFHAGVYGGTQFDTESGIIDLNLGANVIWHQVDTDRTVSFGGLSNNLSADYDAATTQAFAELGYTYAFDMARLQPFAGVAVMHQWTDGFTETGGASALTAASKDTVLGVSTLGVRGDVTLGAVGDMTASLNGSAAWQHAMGDVDSTTDMRFASGGNSFAVSGTPVDRDAALVEAGFSLNRGSDLSVNVAYQGNFSENTRDHGFKAGLKVQF